MRDTVSLLSTLLNLSRISTTRSLSRDDVEHACKEYEDEMMPRAFEWVEKSGDTTLFVSSTAPPERYCISLTISTIQSADSNTWSGYLSTVSIGWVLNMAYYIGSAFSLFQAKENVNEAPEFDGRIS